MDRWAMIAVQRGTMSHRASCHSEGKPEVSNAHGHCQATAVHHPSNEGATLLVVLALGRIIIQRAAHNGFAVARIHTYVPP